MLRRVIREVVAVSSHSTFQQHTTRSCFALNPAINRMAGNVKTMVDGKIQSKKVMIFSKSYCPFCTKAKKVFSELIKKGELSTEDYEVMEIENNPDCDAIQSHLKSLTGASSMPRVFINGKCLGGGDETVSAHQSGQLSKLVK